MCINCFDKNILSITIPPSSSSSLFLRYLGYHSRDNGMRGSHNARRLYATIASRATSVANQLHDNNNNRLIISKSYRNSDYSSDNNTTYDSSSITSIKRSDAVTDADPLMTAKAMSKS